MLQNYTKLTPFNFIVSPILFFHSPEWKHYKKKPEKNLNLNAIWLAEKKSPRIANDYISNKQFSP